MAEIHVLSGVERRRRWSEEQKRALVAAAFAPGALVSEVARRADLRPGQLYRWRRDLRGPASGFAEVVVSAAGVPTAEAAPPIEVMLDNGAQIRIPASASPDLAAAVLAALARR